MKFGLNDYTIESINSVFKSHPEVSKVIIYGSRAKGSFRNGSDIDLVIIGDKISIKTLYKIEDELEECMLQYKFDLSLYKNIDNIELLEHIKRVGKIFFERIPYN